MGPTWSSLLEPCCSANSRHETVGECCRASSTWRGWPPWLLKRVCRNSYRSSRPIWSPITARPQEKQAEALPFEKNKNEYKQRAGRAGARARRGGAPVMNEESIDQMHGDDGEVQDERMADGLDDPILEVNDDADAPRLDDLLTTAGARDVLQSPTASSMLRHRALATPLTFASRSIQTKRQANSEHGTTSVARCMH